MWPANQELLADQVIDARKMQKGNARLANLPTDLG